MNKSNKPESEMMGAHYDPHLSEGSAKVPIFQTSTFVFKNAEEGKSHFHIAYGLREKNIGESMSLAYSRINNPNLEIENREKDMFGDIVLSPNPSSYKTSFTCSSPINIILLIILVIFIPFFLLIFITCHISF